MSTCELDTNNTTVIDEAATDEARNSEFSNCGVDTSSNLETTATTLSWHLKLLFSLNGVTLSLPSTALLYIVNTRAAVPLAYLSVYGALAFLPSSLKPLYALLSSRTSRRDHLICLLLVLSGLSLFATAFVPEGGVAWCFMLAFTREFFLAWPEFLLGVTLVEEVRSGIGDFDARAALFQSQAATARNLGSLFANICGFFFFFLRQFSASEEQLSYFSVVLIFLGTGLLNFLGAVFALYHRIGYAHSSYQLLEDQEDNSTDAASTAVSTRHRESIPSNDCFQGDAILVILLQLMVMTFALREPILKIWSESTWEVFISFLLVSIVLLAVINYHHWNRIQRVGLFLIMKNAVPSSGYLMVSYIYSLFQSNPMVLQLFGIINAVITTFSTWGYGRWLSKYSSGYQFLKVIVVTTMAASFLSFLYILLLDLSHETQWKAFLDVLLVSCFTSFINEWEFLPSVILATTSINAGKSPEVNDNRRRLDELSFDSDSSLNTFQLYQRNVMASTQGCYCGTSGTAIEYGALVSCIDFGDQIASWLTVPLVASLGISRENDWAHMDTLIVITALLSLIPLTFLPIIR
mmetsp:Transcript_16793/g.25382  ORF Transcript_16793/g.25382 Transcript_16793/m.25382 type:complete len:578 (+) Transcript_16793:269-2002(+)